MSVTSSRTVFASFSGDVQATMSLAAATSATSPGVEALAALSSGNNSVAVPTGASAMTVVKPVANTVALRLKAVSGDTGVLLHPTDPDSVSLDPTVTAVVLNAAAPVTVRLIWT